MGDDAELALAEATVEDLLEELGRRFDHVAVVMDGPTGNPTHCRRWTKENDTFTAIGMCLWAVNDWQKGWTNADAQDDEEDA